MSEDTLAKISSGLRETREGTQTVIVRLSRATLSRSQTEGERVQTLKETARQTQQAVEAFASGREGVVVKNSFWIANAVVLEVDTERVSLREIAHIQGVRRIHENFEVEALDSGRPSRSKQVGESGEDGADSLDGDEYTYGLEQINVPEVWDEHGTQGEGAKVAVLDTGIDNDHPDLELYTDDPDDPTYPGGWKEFTGEGYDEPGDGHGHGTHVSGTVAGGDDSGTHIGVAPECDLLHGKVLDDSGSGDFDDIIAGIEWAVEEGADVINMSLGAEGYWEDIIEPLQNVQDAEVLAVSACGNDGEGTSGSPANVYGAGMAVGNSTEDEEIYIGSSGEKIVTAEDWSGADEEDIEDWPDEYIVPDVSAPGTSVISAEPGGDYAGMTGTSMASPHVAGVAALMLSAAGTLEPEQVWAVLEDTAWKPDDWDEGDAGWSIDGKDSRYGKGIVDAKAAVDLVTLESGVEGTVTDASDSAPLEGVLVEIEDGGSITTDEDGEYSILAEADDYTVSADPFGFESQNHSVTVVEDEFTTQDFALDRELDGRVLAAQPDGVEGGDPVETTVETAHADTVTVTQLGDYDEEDADLVVDGDASATFDEPVSIDDGFTEVEISVQTAEDTEGEIALEVTIEDGDGSVQVETGSTTVHEELTEVGVVDATETFGNVLVDTLVDGLGTKYNVETTTTGSVINNTTEYDAVVVQKLDSGSIADFVDATETTDIGVVYLDQWGNEANAIPQFEEVSDAIDETHQDDRFGASEVPVSYEATTEHPIIDEIPVGEAEVIHDGEYADITWFDLASDSGFDVIADAKHGGGVAGSGLAIDEEKNTVLASSLGYSQYVDEDDFTEDATTILASAVSYLSEPQYDETTLEVSDDEIVDDDTAYIEIDATLVDEVTVEYLWIDWDVDAVEGDGADTENNVGTDGTYTFSWNSTKDVADLALAIAPNGDDDNGGELSSDLPTYTGGVFLFTVTADGPETTIEEATTIEILPL